MRRNQVIWACSEIGIDFQSPRERKLNPTHLYDSLNKAEKREPSLAEIFSPRAVAVVGVSSTNNTSFANRVVLMLQKSDFPAIYPVNPKCDEVLGLPCYHNLLSIPGPVDHVVVCIPAAVALPLLDDCAAKKVKSVHFFTAGFSETGEDRQAQLEMAMLRKAKEGGFRIIGPNCVGLFIPKSRLATSIEIPPKLGAISFISQSGGHAEDLTYLSNPRGLRFNKIVSYGNALDVDESELLEYLSGDSDTEIIGAYIEGVKDGRRFFHALKAASARKPVIIYKGGTTSAGQTATRSHTASMTSSSVVFNALCRQLNVIQVDSMEELIDIMVIFQFIKPLPRGTDVAVVGAGGGPSVAASDEMEKAGFHLPTLSPRIQAELKKCLPPAGGGFANPVDATSLALPEVIYNIMNVLGKAPDIHLIVYHLGFHPISRWGNDRLSSASQLKALTDAFARAQRETGKQIMLAMRPAPDLYGTEKFLAAQEALVNAGLPVFHSLSSAARAMAKVGKWQQGRFEE